MRKYEQCKTASGKIVIARVFPSDEADKVQHILIIAFVAQST